MSLSSKISEFRFPVMMASQLVTKGRAIACNDSASSARSAYLQLQHVLKKNRWKEMYNRNLEYELPSEKRKRLARERSERVFRQVVLERVGMAKRMLEMGY
ncbi:hypothetical protein HMI56_006364 [Coelomomyces lativittatus]|nr:hypothetical protein HMI56_006364 [Coelomomyces lativittatus]